MKKDIMETAPPAKKIKNPTMFEVDDKGREYEYGRGYRYQANNYLAPFISFIKSLGFDLKEHPHGGSPYEINGVRFNIDTNNASYKTKNAFTRKVEVRKDKNRFIRFYTGKHGIKIHFNKEYSADTLRKKINAGIDASKSADLEHQKYLDTQKENTVAVGRHFAQDPAVKMHIKQIAIGGGEVSLYSNSGNWFIHLESSGKLKKAAMNSQDLTTIKDVKLFTTQLQADIQNLTYVVTSLHKLKRLSDELIEWTTKTHHKYYSVKADNASN